MVHPPDIRAFTIFCQVRLFRSPLTGFREVRFSRQQYSLNVAACTLARAADQSPPTLSRRQAHPFTAELAPAGVSPSQSLLSLLGPTTYCRGGIFTRLRIKERRLHQKTAKNAKAAPALHLSASSESVSSPGSSRSSRASCLDRRTKCPLRSSTFDVRRSEFVSRALRRSEPRHLGCYGFWLFGSKTKGNPAPGTPRREPPGHPSRP